VKQAASEVTRWSTEEVGEPQRVDYYAAALESSVDPMCIASVGEGAFAAHITAAALGPLSAIHVQGEARALRRGKKELARSAEPHFRLIVNLASCWQLQQRGASVLRPRDVALIDSPYPHMTELPSSFDVIHVKLPEAWVRHWVPRAEDMAGQVIRFDQSWGAALSSFVAQMSPEFATQSPLPLRLIADHLGVLLSLASGHFAGGVVPAPAGSRRGPQLLGAVQPKPDQQTGKGLAVCGQGAMHGALRQIQRLGNCGRCEVCIREPFAHLIEDAILQRCFCERGARLARLLRTGGQHEQDAQLLRHDLRGQRASARCKVRGQLRRERCKR
jgi:hypothetical protein